MMNNVPFVGEIVSSWSKEYHAIRITKTIKDRMVVNEEENISFNGMLQPLNDNEISLKPEGERNWLWFKLYTTYRLNVNDYLLIDDRKYKIMSIKPYQDFTQGYGYYRYNLVENYRENI